MAEPTGFDGDQSQRIPPAPRVSTTSLKTAGGHIRPLLLIILVLCAVRSSAVDWNDVPTGSMKPTIIEGDRIFVNKLAYDLKFPFTSIHLIEWGGPKRGDIVVFYSPDDGTRLVKRVVAVGGDTVELDRNELSINGTPLPYTAPDARYVAAVNAPDQTSHDFLTESLPAMTTGPPVPHALMTATGYPRGDRQSFAPFKVPVGHYFMMGDNRDNSRDSRWFGPVDRKLIVGRAVGVVMSLDADHSWSPRWGRFFTRLR